MGTGRDRRVATLPHFDFAISGTVDQSEYVLRNGKYNFVRKHHSLGTTPAVAAGLEESRGV